MFWLRNKKINILVALLTKSLGEKSFCKTFSYKPGPILKVHTQKMDFQNALIFAWFHLLKALIIEKVII